MSGLIDNLCRIAAVSACVILVGMVAFILVEIVLRSFFDASTYVLDEFVGYGVAVMTFLSFSLALRDGVFIRVNLVTANLGTKARQVLEIVSCAVGTCLFGFIAFYLGRLVLRNFDRGVVSNSIAEVPLWIPQSFVFLGLMLLVIQFASLTVKYASGAPVVDRHEEL
ncbi:MAG: TRAP transporter small permease [Sneathiellales bacterium]|nr:TRAP transporter small permease [Sneathiellales bacterium]